MAVGRTTSRDIGKIVSHRFPMFKAIEGRADVDFITYFFKTELGREQLALASPGGAGRNKTLGQSDFLKLKIRIPPFHEQKRIAEILSAWDRAIETVEALIANARAQKAALMQSLLVGKTRLPGFDQSWQETTLIGVADIIVSNVDKKSSSSEQSVRLCNYMDVYKSDRIEDDMSFMSATASKAQIERFGLRVGDVLITKDSETADDIAVPSYVASTSADLVCGYHLAIIRPKQADGRFLKFLLEQPETHRHFVSRANGATRFGLTVGAIEEAPIVCPAVEEQRLIGEIIGAAEIEVETLQSELIFLRQEKAALMQQLLTGKRRVKAGSGPGAC